MKFVYGMIALGIMLIVVGLKIFSHSVLTVGNGIFLFGLVSLAIALDNAIILYDTWTLWTRSIIIIGFVILIKGWHITGLSLQTFGFTLLFRANILRAVVSLPSSICYVIKYGGPLIHLLSFFCLFYGLIMLMSGSHISGLSMGNLGFALLIRYHSRSIEIFSRKYPFIGSMLLVFHQPQAFLFVLGYVHLMWEHHIVGWFLVTCFVVSLYSVRVHWHTNFHPIRVRGIVFLFFGFIMLKMGWPIIGLLTGIWGCVFLLSQPSTDGNSKNIQVLVPGMVLVFGIVFLTSGWPITGILVEICCIIVLIRSKIATFLRRFTASTKISRPIGPIYNEQLPTHRFYGVPQHVARSRRGRRFVNFKFLR